MLYCVDGRPGAGKTLYTLQHVEKLRQESKRTVYYNGIVDLTLPWVEFDDPKRWEDLPHGSIIVIDEAWRIFEKLPAGTKPPDFIANLATHRHKGYDIFLVTQLATKQIHHFVRGLVNYHYHLRRVFGSEKVRVFYWEELGDPDDWHSRQKAQQSWFAYPPEVFTWYKSAEIHTVQRKIPWKPVATIAAGLILVPLLVYVGYRLIMPEEEVAVAAPKGIPAPEFNRLPKSSPPGGLSDARSFKATIPEIPYTVPAFQAAVRVVSTPQVAGCGLLKIGHRSRCTCNDQQGNKLKLDHRVCVAYLEQGAFNPMRGSKFPEIPAYVPSLAAPSSSGGPDSGSAAPSQAPLPGAGGAADS